MRELALDRPTFAKGVLKLERDGSPRQVTPAEPGTHRFGEQLYRRFDVAGVGEVVRESPLVADGFDVVGRIDSPNFADLEPRGPSTHEFGVDAEDGGEEAVGRFCKLPERPYPHARKRAFGGGTDAAHGADG